MKTSPLSVLKEIAMTHVVAEPCFDCKYTDCVVVCPVECFYQGDQILYIHPDECIDCKACVPECPVEAIFYEDNLPEQWKEYTQLNAEMAPLSPVITDKLESLEGKQCVGRRK
jgi:ferredoxin